MENAKFEIIENAKIWHVEKGDTIIWEQTRDDNGVKVYNRREGVAECTDVNGDWKNENDVWITWSVKPDSTITIHRPIRKPPSENGSVIVAADLRIEAVVNDRVWTALEAVYGPYGVYYGVWRSGKDVRTFVHTEDIQPGTWRLNEPAEETPF